jgi:transposase
LEFPIFDRGIPSLKLKDREWVCPKYGRFYNRDHNAAVNIRKKAISSIGRGTPKFTSSVENHRKEVKALASMA